ncbi:MAG TPA: hypothetical protein VLF87_02990 [Patescibacteria group bacterium]|nr:hypothetical protein [Patescibacteria group bacterium]
MKTSASQENEPSIGPKKLVGIRGKEVTFMPAQGQLDLLKGLAVIDTVGDESVSLGDEIRGAVEAYVNHRRSSPTFQNEVRQAQEAQERALNMLNRHDS